MRSVSHQRTVCESLYNSLSVEVEVNLRPTVSRPVFLGASHPSGTRDQYFFFLDISFRQLRVCYFVAPSLTRGLVCNLLYNCFWALPEQSLLGQSSAELTAIFYCLIWDSPNLEGQVPVFISPKFKFKLYCDRRSVGQFVLVSCPIWCRWPDVTFLWVTITFFIFHEGRPP
jgi:hypothetical protein